MLYLDSPRRVSRNHPNAPRCFRGKMAAHLVADTEGELLHYGQNGRNTGYEPDATKVEMAWRKLRDFLGMKQLELWEV